MTCSAFAISIVRVRFSRSRPKAPSFACITLACTVWVRVTLRVRVWFGVRVRVRVRVRVSVRVRVRVSVRVRVRVAKRERKRGARRIEGMDTLVRLGLSCCLVVLVG